MLVIRGASRMLAGMAHESSPNQDEAEIPRPRIYSNAVTEESRVVERERGWLHRACGRRNFDLSTDLLEQRGIIEKDRLAP